MSSGHCVHCGAMSTIWLPTCVFCGRPLAGESPAGSRRPRSRPVIELALQEAPAKILREDCRSRPRTGILEAIRAFFARLSLSRR